MGYFFYIDLYFKLTIITGLNYFKISQLGICYFSKVDVHLLLASFGYAPDL